jgi:DNA-binding CsgD family transcriptional regulator
MARRAARALTSAKHAFSDTWGHTYYGLQLHLGEAYARRHNEQPALEPCKQAVDVAATLGACVALLPRLLYAEELLVAGRRDEGRTALVQVWVDMKTIGANYLATQAAKLARRQRIPLNDDSVPAGLISLTPREREVLDLLATGAPNKVIARRLAISDKTVSVHVTNLMAKLGVTNRGQAAAVRRQIDDRPAN